MSELPDSIVHAAAQILACRRWNRDDKGRDIFRQLVQWAAGHEDTAPLAPTGTENQ